MSDGEEKWRPVIGFPAYECSRTGHFRNASTHRPITKHRNIRSGRLFVKLYSNRRQHTRHSAGLIAAAWIGERPPGQQVDHRDGDKSNESVENLRYLTGSMNV